MLSTRPRFCAWRANSLWLQWLIGSPLASGGSQAKAMIEQIWAGVKVAGAPGRGLSASRSPTLAAADPASQRRRQRLTVLRHTPSRAAAALTPTPSPAKRMMRARNAICCGVDRARTRLSSLRLLFGTQDDRRGYRVRHHDLARLDFHDATESDSPSNDNRVSFSATMI
jgi:hypothetical protein